MASVSVSIDISGYLENVEAARNKDIPYATALTLTRVAQDGQIEMRRQVAQKFKLRNAWTQQGIKITPAEKVSWPITAEVYTDTANATSGAPDYLVKQEDGGEKVPFGGRQHIAIPTKYLRKYAPSIIPDPMRPRNLLPPDAKLGAGYKGRFDGPSSGQRFQKVGVKRMAALGSREFVAFLQVDKAGTVCIFVRSGSKRDAEPWYVLVPEAHIRAVLGMDVIVQEVADSRFETHWDDAWDSIRG